MAPAARDASLPSGSGSASATATATAGASTRAPVAEGAPRKRRRKPRRTAASEYKLLKPTYLSTEQEEELKSLKGIDRLERVLSHHQQSEERLSSRFKDIIARYSNVNPDDEDEIDLENGVIVRDRGALRRVRRQIDVWHEDLGESGSSEAEGEGQGEDIGSPPRTPEPKDANGDEREPEPAPEPEPMGPARLADLKDMVAFLEANKRMMGGSPLKPGDMAGLPELQDIDTRSPDEIDMAAFDAANARMMRDFSGDEDEDEDEGVDLLNIVDSDYEDHGGYRMRVRRHEEGRLPNDDADDEALSSDGASSIRDPDFEDTPDSEQDEEEWFSPAAPTKKPSSYRPVGSSQSRLVHTYQPASSPSRLSSKDKGKGRMPGERANARPGHTGLTPPVLVLSTPRLAHSGTVRHRPPRLQPPVAVSQAAERVGEYSAAPITHGGSIRRCATCRAAGGERAQLADRCRGARRRKLCIYFVGEASPDPEALASADASATTEIAMETEVDADAAAEAAPSAVPSTAAVSPSLPKTEPTLSPHRIITTILRKHQKPKGKVEPRPRRCLTCVEAGGEREANAHRCRGKSRKCLCDPDQLLPEAEAEPKPKDDPEVDLEAEGESEGEFEGHEDGEGMDVDEPPELPDLEAGNASAESPRVEAPPSSDARATVVAPVKGTRPPKAQSTAPPQTQSPAELPTESQPEPDPEPQPQPQPQPLQPQYSTTIAYGPDNVVQVCEVCYSIGDTWGRNAMYCLGREDLARCAVANAIKLEEQAKAKAKAESKVERKRKRSSVASTRKSASAGTGTMRRGRKSKVKVEEEAGPEQVGGPEAVLDTADTVDPHESPRTPGDPAAASSTVPDAQRLEADDRSPSSSDLEHDPEWIPPVPSASPERAPPPAGEYAATPTRAPTEPTQRRRSGLANFMFRARASLPADGGAGASPLDKLRAENRRHSRAASERPGSESSSRASELRHSISSVRHTPPMRPTRTSPEKAKDGVPDSSPVVVRRKPARPLASSSSPTTSSVTRPDSSTSPRASSSPVNLSGASARTGRKRVLPAQPAAPTPADGQGQDSGVHFRILPFSPALLQRLGADAQQPSPPPPQGSSPSPPHKRVRISDRTDEPRRRPGPA